MIRLAALFRRSVPTGAGEPVRSGSPASDRRDRATLRSLLAPAAPFASGGGWSDHADAAGSLHAGIARLGPVLLGDDADGPAIDPAGRRALLFDGRLDDRAALAAELGLPAAGTPDPELVLAAFERWGDDCLPRLLGPFALVLWEPWRRRLLLARDPMGERTLCRAATAGALVVASTESAVLAHPEVAAELDRESVARHFALRAPRPGRTLFRGIAELEPGEALAVTPDGERSWRFWEPPEVAERGRSDGEWADALREALEASVRCRLAGRGAPAVLMSGGIDSTAIAALAARDASAPVTAISWIFDELSSCDESAAIRRVVEHCGLESVTLAGDRAWPLAEPATWPWDAGRPYSDPFIRLLDGAGRTARRRGSRTLLTGYWGDQLFSGGAGWAGALAAERRWGSLAAAAGQRLLDDPAAARRWARRLLGRSMEEPFGDPWSEALTPIGRELAGAVAAPAAAPTFGESLLGGFHVWMATGRYRMAERLGVEHRDPFRDRRVVELVLRMPADQHLRGPQSRPVLRRAMRGLLPEPVRRRRDKTSLADLFRRGVLERERETVRVLLAGGAWREYLRPAAVEAALSPAGAAVPAARLTTLWLALSFELWRLPLAELGRDAAARRIS